MALPFARASKEIRIMIKTTAEKLREEGRTIGREEGREEGREVGREEGRKGLREGLLTLVDARFGEIPAALRHRIDHADIDELNALLRRAASAASVDDILQEEGS